MASILEEGKVGPQVEGTPVFYDERVQMIKGEGTLTYTSEHARMVEMQIIIEDGAT